jgi:hypothetical protein
MSTQEAIPTRGKAITNELLTMMDIPLKPPSHIFTHQMAGRWVGGHKMPDESWKNKGMNTTTTIAW